MADHSTINHSGITGAGGTAFTVLDKVQVFNGLTTTSTISKTLTGAITGVPATAKMVTGWMTISSDTTANNGNYMELFHGNLATPSDRDMAAIVRATGGSGIVTDMAFTCVCQQSSGAKIYYEVGRAAGTVTYYLTVTGYWV